MEIKPAKNIAKDLKKIIVKTVSTVGRLLPRKNVKDIGKMASMAGIDIEDEFGTGLVILFPIIVFILSLIFIPVFTEFDLLLLIGASLIMVILLSGFAYELIILRIGNRKTEMESVLPDFLQLTAADIRAGMALDKALWYAAKPEFGLLSKEVSTASKRVFSGETLDTALDELASRFNSRYLTRTAELIKEGMASGGEMGSILEKTAIDLRNIQLMQKEISASMIMYSIFIGFSSAIGAPFLYVISHKLVSLFHALRLEQPAETVTTPLIRIMGGEFGFTPDQFSDFALVLVIITNIIGTFFISVIQTGKKENAIKYLFPMLALSLIIFALGRALLDRLFVGLL